MVGPLRSPHRAASMIKPDHPAKPKWIVDAASGVRQTIASACDLPDALSGTNRVGARRTTDFRMAPLTVPAGKARRLDRRRCVLTLAGHCRLSATLRLRRWGVVQVLEFFRSSRPAVQALGTDGFGDLAIRQPGARGRWQAQWSRIVSPPEGAFGHRTAFGRDSPSPGRLSSCDRESTKSWSRAACHRLPRIYRTYSGVPRDADAGKVWIQAASAVLSTTASSYSEERRQYHREEASGNEVVRPISRPTSSVWSRR